MFHLIDIQRVRHPRLQKFTYKSIKAFKIKSRINFFLIAKHLTKSVKKTDVFPSIVEHLRTTKSTFHYFSYSDTPCLQTLFFLFKLAIRCTKELFVLTVNRSLVGTLMMTIGDVSLSIAISIS